MVDATGSSQRLRVFISYSRRNNAFAEDLLTALEACGFDAYLDKRDIEPGEPWEERLERLIQTADSIVFVISQAFVASDRCEWEIAKAAGLGKRLMPLIHEMVPEAQVPERLRRLNYTLFDGDGRSFAKGLADLTRTLSQDLDWVREHTRLGDLAQRWSARGQIEALLLRGSEIEAAKAWIGRQPKDAPAPTLLHREFIAISEKTETERIARERAQQEVANNAEVARLKAEHSAAAALTEAARLKAEKGRNLMLASLLGVVVLAGGGAWIGWREYQNAAQEAKIGRLEADLERTTARIAQLAITRDVQREGPSELASTDVGEAALPQPTPPNAHLESLAPPLPSRTVSKAAVDLILAFEVGGRGGYERGARHPRWPGVASGIVIGIDYDLGYVTREQFEQDWGLRLPPATLIRLRSVLGVKGDAAKSVAESLKDIDVPWEAASAVFQERTLPRFAAELQRNLQNTRALPDDSYGALVSLVFNRGSNFTSEADSRREMRVIRDLMRDRKFDQIPEQIRNMQRLWPNLEILRNRREAEALLFAKGLLNSSGR